ncbi:putative 116 kDa U5 small nuclear ribonucleoprotein component [Gregarina niphandrodes]|uniref:116 kDa U5 small nuclear ribonucleoprotein component n=1 Tax=Gregarina niphandrodes TaxID=110365 RepID=A0A023AWQ1_GRENI|nr:putative 116 kDa U5 small nuclear ribonucleoprotein component [Gregarina niphandrodes]EZG43171.1 putative 116 kDa U5 small nuclear ribonucleoprotein component [Gregarina niphandrodes]|eukprot:XP_011133578.1 putative 116 kDa U5 small nuclear ribonucleoprotein component [Gregarina niphandrodes]
MSEQLYDELGNYIGPELEESEEETSSSSEEESAPVPEAESKALDRIPEYEVDPNAMMIVEEEDAQPITQPIIEPEKTNKFNLISEEKLSGHEYRYLASMRSCPELCRSIAIVGDIHHGKTVLCDLMTEGLDALMDITESETGRTRGGPGQQSKGQQIKGRVTGPNRSTLRSSKGAAHTREKKFTDSRLDEQERGVSIKSSPLCLLLPDLRGKNYLINVLDTPGHVNFLDEVSASVRLSDGAVLCVDALQGPMIGFKKTLQILAHEEVNSMVLYLSCIDRLILELRLPPPDAYLKLRYVIGEVNKLVRETWTSLGKVPPKTFDPAVGNVVFGSGRYSFVFSLRSFAEYYANQKHRGSNPNNVSESTGESCGEHAVYQQPMAYDADTLTQIFWGDIWLNPQTRKFQKKKPAVEDEDEDEDEAVGRTFVDFILKPIYKIFSHVVGEEKPTLKPTLENDLGIFLEESDYDLDTRTLLKKVCRLYFAGVSPLVSAVVEHIPSPKANAHYKVMATYSGSLGTAVAKDMLTLNSEGRCIVHTTKSYHRHDNKTFDVFGRVMSGVLRRGMRLKVLGERYSLHDAEDMALATAEHLWIYQSRFRIEVEAAPAGSWVLIGGVDATILKSSTLAELRPVHPSSGPVVDEPEAEDDWEDEVETFRPLYFAARNVVRIACEPIAPAELPKLVEGLRRVAKAYPSVRTHVEDSGAHVLVCAGELAADCALHDLRVVYGDLELRCADPGTVVCETVIGETATAAAVGTPNGQNKLTLSAGPLEEALVSAIDAQLVHNDLAPRELADLLKKQYGWDTLAARSVWAFGSQGLGVQGLGAQAVPSVLLNDILPSRTDTKRRDVNVVKDFITHGFQWAVREGPLIEEEVRNVKFRLIDATIAPEPLYRNSGQVIPTARRAAYAALLTAEPRLMEPMLLAEVVCPADCVTAVVGVLARRRGRVLSDLPNPGTPLETVLAFVPATDAFGLETDIRIHTSGQAFIQTVFDRWETLPGDPLDTSIRLRPFEPAPLLDLAREFLLKTRRRKGLSDDVSIKRFLD